MVQIKKLSLDNIFRISQSKEPKIRAEIFCYASWVVDQKKYQRSRENKLQDGQDSEQRLQDKNCNLSVTSPSPALRVSLLPLLHLCFSECRLEG